MSILSIDLHSSNSMIQLSFHFQDVTYESLDDIYCSKFRRAWMTASTLRLITPVRRRMSVVIAAAIPDAMLLPTDKWVAQEVPEHVYDGLTCPKYTLWDSNPGSWLAKEQKSRLRFGGRRLMLLNDEAWRCHPYTQAL